MSDAVLTCSLLTANGYDLPYGDQPLVSRGPVQSMIALITLGAITRLLAYLSLLCLDRGKR